MGTAIQSTNEFVFLILTPFQQTHNILYNIYTMSAQRLRRWSNIV